MCIRDRRTYDVAVYSEEINEHLLEALVVLLGHGLAFIVVEVFEIADVAGGVLRHRLQVRDEALLYVGVCELLAENGGEGKRDTGGQALVLQALERFKDCLLYTSPSPRD